MGKLMKDGVRNSQGKSKCWHIVHIRVADILRQSKRKINSFTCFIRSERSLANLCHFSDRHFINKRIFLLRLWQHGQDGDHTEGRFGRSAPLAFLCRYDPLSLDHDKLAQPVRAYHFKTPVSSHSLLQGVSKIPGGIVPIAVRQLGPPSIVVAVHSYFRGFQISRHGQASNSIQDIYNAYLFSACIVLISSCSPHTLDIRRIR